MIKTCLAPPSQTGESWLLHHVGKFGHSFSSRTIKTHSSRRRYNEWPLHLPFQEQGKERYRPTRYRRAQRNEVRTLIFSFILLKSLILLNSFRKPNPEFSRASFQVQDLRETLNKRYQEKANDYGKTHKAVNSVGVKSNPVDLIKHTMSKLYNLETRVMNLSNFQQAEQFIKQGIFIAINKAKEFRNVVNIIVQSSPDIVALNLSNNKLSILEPLQSLADKCSSLKALDLSKNNVCINVKKYTHL